MEKKCIFCGEKPEEKNKEHVIPRWLIELTGDPKRAFSVGPFWNQKSVFLTFAADQFQFPSCEKCNNDYSKLEVCAKSAIEKMLIGQQLVLNDLIALLDWFDKVRIGLWLGYRYLDKNSWGIIPNYYINSRIAKADRLLAIYKLSEVSKGINFAGINSPIFAHNPTMFVLRINDLVYYNVSGTSLISKRIGFPFCSSQEVFEDGRNIVNWENGTRKIWNPIIRERFPFDGDIIMQAILPDYDVTKEYFEKSNIEYVEAFSYKANSGRSYPIAGRSSTIIKESTDFRYNVVLGNPVDAYKKIVLDCLKRQLEISKRTSFSKDDKKAYQLNAEKVEIEKMQRYFIKLGNRTIAST